MGAVVAAMVPGLPEDWTTPFWCADAAGEWAFRPHTAAQIIQAGVDGKAHIVSCQMRLAAIAGQIASASSLADVSSIAWE